ncbi:MAG: hypothetical protein A2V69_01070 [Candidatus Portnoybacteria bacterium RBG_13_40_8]|uniref:Uncharacterized protein n=1 Tax=Candidatus Portnoybacteria bacterium RBG_13_40_8 TaxID=1801990 RepID=A0A1G2F3R4_9BACT|nr:MAG: hypothetical protein A2V69_01070 [Candidatus Portnoybacteria bacterium RBG_13_40_8]
MKIKELTVGTGRKVGQPGYSSIDVSTFVTVELENGEDSEKVFKKAWDMVEGQVLGKLEEKGIDSPVASEVPESRRWLDHEVEGEAESAKVAKQKIEKTKELFDPIPSVTPHRDRKGGVL